MQAVLGKKLCKKIEQSSALHCVSDALTDESEGCLAEHGSDEWRPAAEWKREHNSREVFSQQDIVPPDLRLRSENAILLMLVTD